MAVLECFSSRGSGGVTPDNTGYTEVRGGATARPVRQLIYPTHCFDRFAILEEDGEQQNTFLVLDSMICQRVVEFCGRVPRGKRSFCFPGAKVDESPLP